MEKNISSALISARSLFYVKKELVKLFRIMKRQSKGGITRIGYVAGIINSDGPKHFEINRKKLANHAEKLRKIHKFPMFSAVDVFSTDVFGEKYLKAGT